MFMAEGFGGTILLDYILITNFDALIIIYS